MHAEVREFLRNASTLLASRVPYDPPDERRLDIGSRNVNGSVRSILGPAYRVVGLDRRAGPGVDVVGDASDRCLFRADHFTYIYCAETLEHTPFGEQICANAHYWLTGGGVLLVTCAGPARAPHGCDGGPLAPGEYYQGVSEAELRRWLRPFALVLTYDRVGQDVYALALK